MEYKQLRNPQLVAQLSSDFYRRNDVVLAYENLGMTAILPFCRAAFLWSAVESTANPRIPDLTGASSSLRESGTPEYGIYTDTLISYGQITAGEYWYAVTAGWESFSGTETYIKSANQGMTLLAWVRWTAAAAATEVAVGKYSGTNRSYRLLRNAAGNIAFAISSGGGAWDGNIVTTTAPANDTDWHFIAGKFETGSRLYVRCDSDFEEAATAIAAINTNLVAMHVGNAVGGGNSAMSFAALGFYGGALSDAHIKMYYHATAPLFNKQPTD